MRIVLSAVAAAVIFFVWNMMSWLVLGIHDTSLHRVEDESAVVAALASQGLQPGFYAVPMPAEEDADTDAATKKANMDAFLERHKEGPVVGIIYSGGQDPMSAQTMLSGLGLNFAAALVAGLLLSSATCCRAYWARVGFVLGLGLFAALVGHLPNVVWMYYPLDYTLPLCLDLVAGWTLAGLAMAAVIKPPAVPATA